MVKTLFGWSGGQKSRKSYGNQSCKQHGRLRTVHKPGNRVESPSPFEVCMTVQELVKSIHEIPPMTEEERQEFYAFVRERGIVYARHEALELNDLYMTNGIVFD